MMSLFLFWSILKKMNVSIDTLRLIIVDNSVFFLYNYSIIAPTA